MCYLEIIHDLPPYQNQVITMAVLRFLHEDERWNSNDFGTKIMRTLMTVRGRRYIKNVEGEILLIFIAQIVPHCPGLSLPPPVTQEGSRTGNILLGASSLNQTEILARINHILEMARVLHGLLDNFQFKDFGEDTWIAFDLLLRIYISIVDAVVTGNHNEEDAKTGRFSITRGSKEWDMTESALRGCIKNFIDDVMNSNLRSVPCKRPNVNYPLTVDDTANVKIEKYIHSTANIASSAGGKREWDNMSQVLIAVLTHAISSKISSEAQNQLLDLIVMATRIPVGYRSLFECLPDNLISLILQGAQIGDSGVNLRCLKLFQHLLDRHTTRFHLLTPRIFKEYSRFSNIELFEDDLEYFRLYREDMYDMLYKSFLTQSHTLVSLEALYCVICLILIEIQFPIIARDIAELMINIQDAIITMPDLPIQSPRVSAWIHSTVASVLSFIASIHGLTELEALVAEIVNLRSEVAPFLLPPLKAKHTIRDITDFKGDLFFSQASVRRCLTNSCFENSKARTEDELVSVSSFL